MLSTIDFSDQAVFFKVINGLGKPIEGLKITAVNTSDTREGFTTEEGKCILELSDTATITLQKDKAFKTLTYDRNTQGNNLELVFQVPMME